LDARLLAVERRWHESDAQFAAALNLDPNNADALVIQSDLSVLSGRPMEASDLMERALRLNPRPIWWYWWLLGQAQSAARQYDRAAKTLRREETYRTESRRSWPRHWRGSDDSTKSTRRRSFL
jgi:predicted Zn-dependent protease